MDIDAIESQSTARAARYRAVWRWHFYAGLFVAPVLIVLAITGAIYLFDHELDAWWNAEVHTVEPGEAALSLAAQERAVLAAHPHAKIGSVRLPRARDEASLWSIDLPPDDRRDVYVDPYRAAVVGDRDPDTQPLTIVRELHGSLLAGPIGGYLVELVACWTLVMLITGIYMWWPRNLRLRAVFALRIREQGRVFWRDLHAVPASFNALLVGMLVLTGLPWSVFWGAQFAKLGEGVPFVAPSPNFKSPPVAEGVRMASHAQHRPDSSQLPWTIGQLTPPQASGQARIGIAEVERHLRMLPQATFGPGVRIFYPADAKGVYTISYVPDKAEGQRTLYIDPASGAAIESIAWGQYSPVAKAVEWGVMTHVGRQYGVINQLVNLLVCLTLIATVVAGLYLWWNRRPKGALGAPPVRATDDLPRALLVTMVTCAVLFPLIGASLLAVLIIDWISCRYLRAQQAKQSLGARGP